jgi:hypothetical protein
MFRVVLTRIPQIWKTLRLLPASDSLSATCPQSQSRVKRRLMRVAWLDQNTTLIRLKTLHQSLLLDLQPRLSPLALPYTTASPSPSHRFPISDSFSGTVSFEDLSPSTTLVELEELTAEETTLVEVKNHVLDTQAASNDGTASISAIEGGL